MIKSYQPRQKLLEKMKTKLKCGRQHKTDMLDLFFE